MLASIQRRNAQAKECQKPLVSTSGQITELARALPRAQVVDRARAALDLLSRPSAPADG